MTLEYPNYYDSRDRYVYAQLEKEMRTRELTKAENDFYTTMYHLEEYASGLDGDQWGDYEEEEDDDEY